MKNHFLATFLAAFLATGFLAATFLAAGLATFLAATFLGAVFLTTFLGAVFLATTFLGADLATARAKKKVSFPMAKRMFCRPQFPSLPKLDCQTLQCIISPSTDHT